MSRRGKRAVSIEALGTVDLPARQADALEAVREHPGHTALELEHLTGQRRISSRLLELEDAGLVVAGEVRKDDYTGRRAHVYFVADGRTSVAEASLRPRKKTAERLRGELERERRARLLAEAERDSARKLVASLRARLTDALRSEEHPLW